MGIENPIHILFIAAVALVVLGPKRLPEVARSLGRGVREFREAMNVGSSPANGSAYPMPPQQPVQSQPVPAPAAAQHVSASAVAQPASAPGSPAVPPAPVDPPEPVRSGDAPDHRPL